MKGSNSDLGGCSCSEFDFGFAFNDSHFSDRVLRIEIIPDSCTRRLEEVLDLTAFHDEQVLNGNQIPVVRVKTLYISSVILAAKSPFFHKLFSNGMRESEQGHITLRINLSEEDALMELLSFIYTNTLNISAPPAVFHVLIAADKFVVPSCLRYCTNWLLRNSPMTTDFALMYLEHQLPHADSIIQPLFDAAKQYLLDRYKDLTEEVMGFPFSGIELVLASDHLQVDSEDFVCDFVLQWARQHYTKQNKARSLVLARLAHLIRFPYMTCQKLKEVLTCDEFRPLVVEALIFKAKPLHLQRQQSLAAVELNHCRFVGRAYKHRPVKVVTLECATLLKRVVYWDLKKEECATLFPSGRLYSQAFHLSGQEFFLSVQCNMDEQEEGSFHCFGLFLGMKENSSVSLAVDYEFAARSKRKEEFVREYKDNYTFTGGEVVGKNLFAAMPWDYFITEDEDSLFFINGVLHLRAELTIKC